MNGDEHTSFLRSLRIALGLAEEEIQLFSAAFVPVSFYKNQTIFSEAARDDGMYVIIHGDVVIRIPAQVPIDLLTLGAGDYFGEFSLLDNKGRSSEAVATADCELLYISKVKFDDLCETHPRLGYRLVRNIAEKLCFFLRKGDRTVKTWFMELGEKTAAS